MAKADQRTIGSSRSVAQRPSRRPGRGWVLADNAGRVLLWLGSGVVLLSLLPAAILASFEWSRANNYQAGGGGMTCHTDACRAESMAMFLDTMVIVIFSLAILVSFVIWAASSDRRWLAVTGTVAALYAIGGIRYLADSESLDVLDPLLASYLGYVLVAALSVAFGSALRLPARR